MLKKISIVCAVLLGSSLALGQEQSIEVRGGASMPLEHSFKDFGDSSGGIDLETETSAGFSLAYQQRFSDPLSWGAEFQYSSPADVRFDSTAIKIKSKISTMRVFANLLASKNVNGLMPFVGVGLGMANVMLDKAELVSPIATASIDSNSVMNFAFQMFGGLNFNLSEKLYTGFSFRFCNVGEAVSSKKISSGGISGSLPKAAKTTNDVKFSEFSLALGFML